MTHSPESAFPSRSAAEATTWWWRHEDADGADVTPDPRPEFPSRGEAETWLGEAFPDLADDGVAAVTLFEDDQQVYGPMSLSEG